MVLSSRKMGNVEKVGICNKKVGLLVIILVFLSVLVMGVPVFAATQEINNSFGVSYALDTADSYETLGEILIVRNTTYVTDCVKFNGDTRDVCLIYNQSETQNGSYSAGLLGNATFSGLRATFDVPIKVVEGSVIWYNGRDVTSPRTIAFDNAPLSVPVLTNTSEFTLYGNVQNASGVWNLNSGTAWYSFTSIITNSSAVFDQWIVLGGEINGSHHNVEVEGQLSFSVNNTNIWDGAYCVLDKYNVSSGLKVGEVGSFYSGSDPIDDYVGYWNFNENFKDHSGFGNDGTISGDVANTTGIIGGAYHFNGNTDYVNLVDNAYDFGTNSFTMSAWIKTTKTDQRYIIHSWSGTGYQMYKDGDQELALYIQGNTGSTVCSQPIINLNDDNFHYVSWVIDRNNNVAKGFVDGFRDGSNCDISGIGDISNAITTKISRDSTAAWNGTIDEVKIWNRSLSDLEIQEQYRRRAMFYLDKADVTQFNVWNPTLNATNNGATLNTSRLIGTQSLFFDGTDYINTSFKEIDLSSNFSVVFWAKTQNTVSQYVFGGTDGVKQFGTRWAAGDIIDFLIDTTAGTTRARSTGAGLKDDDWHHFVFTKKGNTVQGMQIWADGQSLSLTYPNTAVPNAEYSTVEYFIGSRNVAGSPTNNWIGSISNLMFFGVGLNQSEITRLYNEDISKYRSFNDSDFSSTTEEGFRYETTCNKSLYGISNTATSNNLTIFVDNVNPTMTFGSRHINTDNSSFVYGSTASFNISFSDKYLFRTRINVSSPSNPNIYFNDSGTLDGSTITYWVNDTMNLDATEEKYNIFYAATDTHTAKKIKQYDLTLDKEKKQHKYKTEYDNDVSIELLNYDVDQLLSRKEVDRHIFGYRFGDDKTKILEIKVGCSGELIYLPKSKYEGHMICYNGMDGNWIDFEGGKIQSVKKEGNDYIIKTKVSGNLVEFNSLGGLNIVNKTITFERKNVNHTIYWSTPLTYSDASILNNTYTLEVLGVYGDYDPYANMTYNGTVYNYVSRTNTTPNNFNYTFNINIPVPDSGLFNDTYFFGFNYSFNDYSFSTLDKEQTIILPKVSTCGVGASYPVLNLTYRNEINNEVIAINNSYNLDFGDGFTNFSFIGSFSNHTSDLFCSNINPSDLTYNWGLSGTFTMSKDDYITRIFSIPEEPTTYVSNNPTTYMDLFLIPTNESSTITFTWQTTEFEYIDGTMLVYRCNANGSRSIVESTPITGGEAIANLQLLFTPYSYEVIIDGQTYTKTPGWTSCHIESSTTRSFYVDTSQLNILPVIGLFLVDCELKKISNNTVSMVWAGNEQDNTLIEGCLVVKRNGINGLTEINRTCKNQTSGNFTSSFDVGSNYFVVGEITQNGVVGMCRNEVSFTTRSEAQGLMGGMGLFGVFILIVSLAAMFSATGEKMVIGSILGLLVSFFIGILAFPWQTVFSIISFLVILVIIGRYSRK